MDNQVSKGVSNGWWCVRGSHNPWWWTQHILRIEVSLGYMMVCQKIGPHKPWCPMWFAIGLTPLVILSQSGESWSLILDRHRDAQQQNVWFGFISGLGYGLWTAGVSKGTKKRLYGPSLLCQSKQSNPLFISWVTSYPFDFGSCFCNCQLHPQGPELTLLFQPLILLSCITNWLGVVEFRLLTSTTSTTTTSSPHCSPINCYASMHMVLAM